MTARPGTRGALESERRTAALSSAALCASAAAALTWGAASLAASGPASPASGQSQERSERPSPALRFALGQRPFSPASSWNRPVAANAAYGALDWPASTGYNYSVAWKRYSPAVYVASPADPLVQVTHPPGWGYSSKSVSVRMPAEADGAAGTDGELLVIDGDVVHNFWRFKRLGPTTAAAQSYAAANVLTDSGWGSRAPFRGAGIVATGSSQLAGLLVQAETDEGEIEHALQLVIESSLAKPGYTGEAIRGDGRNPDGIVQEGDRLAIPPAAPMPPGLSPLGQKVFRAYQRYGAYVVDVADGVTNLRAQANAYDAATITLLWRDLSVITPMLQRVE